MTPWRSLSATIADLAIPPDALACPDRRMAASMLAIGTWGVGAVVEATALLNVAGLALSRIDGTGRIVEADVPPERGGRVLADEWTASLGWYRIDGRLYVVGVGYPDGVRVAVVRDGSIDCPEAAWARDAVAFALAREAMS